MKIKLKYRDLQENRTNVSIEYFKGNFVDSQNKGKNSREFENLNLYLYTESKNEKEELHNQKVMEQAEFILSMRKEDFYLDHLEMIIRESEELLFVKKNKKPNYSRVKALINKHKPQYSLLELEEFNQTVLGIKTQIKHIAILKDNIKMVRRNSTHKSNSEISIMERELAEIKRLCKENIIYILTELKILIILKEMQCFVN